jgi:hypothetical protein
MRMENVVESTMRKEIDELSRMPVSQLRQKYLEVFGEGSRSNHKQFLFRRKEYCLPPTLRPDRAERRLDAIMNVSVEADLLKTLPCVGKILSMVLMLEIGSVDRFPAAAHLASYAGLVPRVHSSGGHTRMGQVCGNVNRNLKWAFVEIGNLVVVNQRRLAGSHVVRRYQRIRRAKNHQKAVVAVARHLAEAAWWVLTKQEVYREPQGPRQQALSSTHG